MTQIFFTPTELGQISSSLQSFFSEMGSEATISLGSLSNVIVPLSSPAKLTEFEATFDLLAELHPSRFIFVVADKQSKDLVAGVSARCKSVAKGEHLCTEMIKLSFPETVYATLPSLIQANLLTGASTELFLADANLDRTLLKALLPLSEALVLDSQRFGQNFLDKDGLAELLLSCPIQIVDFQWLALSVWRDQVKELFSKKDAQALVGKINKIRLSGSFNAAQQPGSALWLLFGWIAQKLELHPIRRDQTTFQVVSAHGAKIVVEMLDSKGSLGVSSLELGFAEDSSAKSSLSCVLSADKIECKLATPHAMQVFSTPLEAQGELQLLQRYFLIGVSTANYRSALERALLYRNFN